jgi:hypothetical protein
METLSSSAEERADAVDNQLSNLESIVTKARRWADTTSSASAIALAFRSLKVKLVGDLVSGNKQVTETSDAFPQFGILDAQCRRRPLHLLG